MSKVAVMVPIGFLMCIAARGYAGRAAIARGFLFAFGIELAQVFIYSRSASTTDVILGTLGAAFGVALARTCGPAAPKPIQDTWFWRTFGWPLKLAATFSAFAAVAWTKCWPFNLAWPPEGAVEHCVAALQVPFFYHYYTTEFMAAIMVARVAGAYFVLGLLLKSLLGPTRGASIASMIVLLGFAAAMEVAVSLLPNKPPDVTDVILAAVGSLFGVRYCSGFFRLFLSGAGPAGTGSTSERAANS